MLCAGLALGDVPNRQPIGIVLTVLGVVVLDFSADATEGPIRAYLLDVVDSEEQDMALNIHAFSAGNAAAPSQCGWAPTCLDLVWGGDGSLCCRRCLIRLHGGLKQWAGSQDWKVTRGSPS